jgi:hypothetical protein
MSELPRLTGALRAFTGLSGTSLSESFQDEELLKKRQFMTKKKTSVEGQ